MKVPGSKIGSTAWKRGGGTSSHQIAAEVCNRVYEDWKNLPYEPGNSVLEKARNNRILANIRTYFYGGDMNGLLLVKELMSYRNLRNYPAQLELLSNRVDSAYPNLQLTE